MRPPKARRIVIAVYEGVSNGVKLALLEGQLLTREIDRATFIEPAANPGLPAPAIGDAADKFMAIAANQAARRATLRSSYDYIVIGYSMAGRDDRVPNALGGLIGGAIVDNLFGASAIPFAAAVVPALALLFILSQERGSSVAPALSQPSLKEGTL
jgi:hypothetical protein